MLQVECTGAVMAYSRTSNLLVLLYIIVITLSVCADVAKRSPNTYEGFRPWSDWSDCNLDCQQVRYRDCKRTEVCGVQQIVDRRQCPSSSTTCKMGRGEINQQASRAEYFLKRHQERKSKSQRDQNMFASRKKEAESASLWKFYSPWSVWSRCTRSCAKRRYKYCVDRKMCGHDVKSEEIRCAPKGSFCERQITSNSRNQEDVVGEANDVRELENHSSTQSVFPPHHGFNDSTCGLRKINKPQQRIHGGRPSYHGKWPWQVALLTKYKEPYCGGTIIADQWVLTAAHCVKKKFFVLASDYNFREEEGTEQLLRIKEAYRHPKYNHNTYDNDIGLVLLEKAVDRSDYALPACLPTTGQSLPPGTACYIAGWGKRRNSHHFGTDELHEVRVPLVTHSRCRVAYDNFNITGNMLCAGFAHAGRGDSCGGDSGGSLMCKVRGDQFLAYGVTSFGEGCGNPGKYGVYSRVPNYSAWIHAVVTGREKPKPYRGSNINRRSLLQHLVDLFATVKM